jgi:uncharacterized protein YaaR (DUF327 family)
MEKLDRSFLYSEVKRLNLQDKVKEIYGKNFTQVPSLQLKTLIDDVTHINEEAKEIKEEEIIKTPKETKQIIKETVDEKLEDYKVLPATQKASPTQITKIETQLDKISKSLVRLCSKLQQLRVLSADDVKHILE